MGKKNKFKKAPAPKKDRPKTLSWEDLQAQYHGDAEPSASQKQGNDNSRTAPKKEESSQANTPYVPSPYNFVPLNSFLVPSEVEEYREEGKELSEAYRQFLATETTYSGYIKTRIETLTPLYIEGEKGMFSNGSRICIPGSSFKGCLKNMLKIYTSGAFRGGRHSAAIAGDENFDQPDLSDRFLYYRSFASACKSFKDLYTANMTTSEYSANLKKNVQRSKAKAGFLVMKDRQYYICPASFKRVKVEPKEYYPGPDKAIQWANNGMCEATVYPNRIKGMNRACHYYVIHSPHWETLCPVSEDIIRSYERDAERKGLALISLERGVKENLAKGFGKAMHGYEFVIPCFYVDDEQGVVKHFGANPYYRIPYDLSISDHIPQGLQASVVDFSEAMFGFKDQWAGRIFVEDSYSENNGPVKQYAEAYAKPLLNPKPTSFQFYLCPDRNGEAQHWDTKGALIRGYKQYWHKPADWRGEQLDNEKILHKLSPVKEGQVFVGKVRFERLTAVELGALLYFFQLGEEGCAYKLGMGKPLGLGSIKVEGQLYLEDQSFYESLFDGDCFAQGHLDRAEGQSREEFVDAFLRYMKEQLETKNSKAWEKHEQRMKALKIMLDPKGIYLQNQDKWNKATRYVMIDAVSGNKADKDLINRRYPIPTIERVDEKRNS